MKFNQFIPRFLIILSLSPSRNNIFSFSLLITAAGALLIKSEFSSFFRVDPIRAVILASSASNLSFSLTISITPLSEIYISKPFPTPSTSSISFFGGRN